MPPGEDARERERRDRQLDADAALNDAFVAAAGSDDSAARSRGDYGYAQARRASPRGDPSARVGKTNPIPVRRCYFSSNLELTARSFVFVSLSLSLALRPQNAKLMRDKPPGDRTRGLPADEDALASYARRVNRPGQIQVRSIQKFFTHRPVSTFDRVPFQLTGELFLYGTALRASRESRRPGR